MAKAQKWIYQSSTREILKLLLETRGRMNKKTSKAIRAEQAMHANANKSEAVAREKYGNRPVTIARNAAIKAGLANKFIRMRDPYAALMKWHLDKSK